MEEAGITTEVVGMGIMVTDITEVGPGIMDTGIVNMLHKIKIWPSCFKRGGFLLQLKLMSIALFL